MIFLVSSQVVKPLSQVLSSVLDQDIVHLNDNDSINSDDLQKTYTVDEFEVRILEPGKSGGQWETKATISMQTSENALTVRVVTLLVSCCEIIFSSLFDLGLLDLCHTATFFLSGSVCLVQNMTTKENETLLAIGTAYVQGEDVAARGRMLLYSFAKHGENSQNLVVT